MTRSLAATAAALVVGGVVAGCGSSGGGTPAGGSKSTANGAGSPSPALVSLQGSGAGAYLVDRSGRPLYSPIQDSARAIRCVGGCTAVWSPLTVTSGSKLDAGSGVSGKLATVKRPGGARQVTYQGHPLYRFKPDKSAGKWSAPRWC